MATGLIWTLPQIPPKKGAIPRLEPFWGLAHYGKMDVEQFGAVVAPGNSRMTQATNSNFFVPSPHLCDTVNRRIVQSEIEGGVHLRDVTPGTVLEVRTQNRSYTVEYRGSGQALISGHPVFCPEPILVSIHGSTWGGSMLKEKYIGRGMCLEFGHPAYQPITTSAIVDVREKRAA
jgi:hypothetical protein